MGISAAVSSPQLLMRSEHSDEEEGFISTEFEVKRRAAMLSRPSNTPQMLKQSSQEFRVNYRFAHGFIKKEPPQAYTTPLNLPSHPAQAHTHERKRKAKQSHSHVHPYREYCVGEEYSLRYSRTGEEPLLPEKEYMKNIVPLIKVEEPNSPAVKELKPWECEAGEGGRDEVGFDSRFEGGNLHCAFRRGRIHEYHLFISNDTNTLGYNQWFYFAVSNLRKGVAYSFKIVNYKKPLSFYRHGQRVAVFSQAEASLGKSGWYRGGNHFSFEENHLRSNPDVKLYTLSFEIEAAHDRDLLLLASSVPYSYSRLRLDLLELQKEAAESEHARVEVRSACLTVCNNEVPEVTICSKRHQKGEGKRVLVFLARQHPGEVWSSYMALGVMRALLKPTSEVGWLLEQYVVKVFPMVNVDGVVYGNFRCDATGVDLNRRWKEPSKVFHPQVHDIRRRIAGYHKRSRVEVCMDLHGHSKHYNVFCYACKTNSYTCRVLPLLIEAHNHMFHLPSCTFGLTRDKETTARAAISRIIKSENVLTLETSSYGHRIGLEPRAYNPVDIYRMADSIAVALRYFLDKKSEQYASSEREIRENFSKYQGFDRQNENESGSDSAPEEDEIDFKVKLNTIFDQKFLNQSKSFIKAEQAAALHRTDLVFQRSPPGPTGTNSLKQSQERLKGLEGKSRGAARINRKRAVRLFQEDESSERLGKGKTETRGTIPRQKADTLSPKKSLSIYHSNIGSPVSGTMELEGRKDPKSSQRNLSIRDKRRDRLSFINEVHKRDLSSFEQMTLDDYDSAKSREGKASEQEQMSSFILKFEKFMPAAAVMKARSRLDLLEEGLAQDDPQSQLNLLFENKRRVEERIKRSIQDSTELAERQGKIKQYHRKEAIVDFRKFKQNERIRQQLRRAGDLSERYYD